MKKIFYFLLFFSFCSSVSFSQIIDQSNIGVETNSITIASSLYAGQYFKAGLTGTLVRVDIDYSVTSCGMMSLYIEDSIGSPLASQAVNFTGNLTRNLYQHNLISPPAVTAGTLYNIDLIANSCSGGGGVNWFYSVNNPYAGGTANLTQTAQPADDFYFRTWVQTGSGIAYSFAALGLSIFPNPTSKKIFADVSSLQLSQKCSLELIDPIGKIMLTMDISGRREIEIDIQEIPKGIYFLRISSENKIIYDKIVLK